MHFKIDWASLIVGSKFTVLLCFTLDVRAIFQVQAPGGLYLEGLIHGGAYFRNFTVCTTLMGFPVIASDGSPLFVEPMFLFG